MDKYLAVLNNEAARVSIIRLASEQHDTIMHGDSDDVIRVAAVHGIDLTISCDWMVADNINISI